MRVGISDNAPIVFWDGDSDFFFSHLKDLGMSTCRLPWYLGWKDPWFENMHEALVSANEHGIEVSVVFMGEPSEMLQRQDVARYCETLDWFLTSFREVKRIVCWNEPNSRTFYRGTTDLFCDLLLQAHKVCRSHNVIMLGCGLAASHSPVTWLAGVAGAYKSKKRTQKLMDEVSYHPYPGYPLDGSKSVEANLIYFMRQFRDMFKGTLQPQDTPLNLDECGWQTTLNPDHASAYVGGPKRIKTVTEKQQAQYHVDMIGVAQRASARSLCYYKLCDEPDLLKGWQSGCMRADRSQKPSYDALRGVLRP